MSHIRPELEPVMKPLARKVNLAVWLDRAVGPAALVVALVATLHLVAKMIAPQFAWWVLSASILLPAALVMVYRACRHKGLFFQPQEVAEVVDHLYRNDGQVTAVYEKPELSPGSHFYSGLRNEMANRLPRLRPGHYARRLTPALLYAAVALAIPPRAAAIDRDRQAALDAVSQPLIERLEAIKEILPEEKKEELEQELKQVAENNEGISKEQWEAVEELEKRLEDAAAEGGLAAMQTASALSDLATMVGASGSPGGGEMSPEAQSRMDELVSQLSDQASGEGGSKIPGLSPDQVKKLTEALGQCKGGKCKGNSGNAKAVQDALKNLAKSLEGKCQGGNCMGQNGDGNKPGKGGINRGRGDAPYVLGEEETLGDAEFQDAMLDNPLSSQENMADLGVLRVEPKPDPGKFNPGTMKSFKPQEGTHVSRTRIGPGQRAVIEKYFN